MSKLIMPVLLTLLLLAGAASPANAYIGPGAGISVLGSLLGILATIFVAIGAIIFWPLRKFLKRRKLRRDSLTSIDAVSTNDDKHDDDANDHDTNDRDTKAGS